MTQVSKTFIISEIAKTPIDPVNINNMFTFKKQDDILNVGMTKTTSYVIAFYKADPYLDHNPILWKYESESERDCDYNKLINLYTDKISSL